MTARRISACAALALLAWAPGAAQAYTTPGHTPVRSAPKTKPPVVTEISGVALPAGAAPRAIVDDAGTAHITLVPSGPNLRTAAYCRLKRGARACDNPALTLPEITDIRESATTLPFRIEAVRPFVLGGSLLVVGTATGGGPRRPDGTSIIASVWLWESRDGGQSFDPPVLIGDTRTTPVAVFGSPDAPRLLALRGDNVGGGWSGAVLSTAAVTVDETPLLPPEGRLASAWSATTQDGVPVFAYSTNAGTSVVTPASADRALDAAGYATARLPGGQVSVAGGPGGVLAVTSTPRGATGEVAVRSVRGAQAGAPQALGEGFQPAISQHATGAVAVAAVRRDTRGVSRLALASGWAGRLTTPGELALPAALRASPTLQGLAIGPDGGGFALASAGSGVRAPAYALGLGESRPTGRPGLGGLAGGGGALPSGVGVSCTRVTIGKLVMRALAGCLLPAADGSGRRVSESTLRVGGMDVVPDRGVKIVADPRRRTLDTTGAVTVRLRGGDLDIPVFRGELHLTIPRGSSGDLLASLPMERTTNPRLGGFELKGDADITITARGVRIPVAVQLPTALSGVRGGAVLETDEGGLRTSSVVVEADLIPIPGGEIRDLRITYASGGSWSGGMRLVLHGGLELKFAVAFQHGRFQYGRVGVSRWPGLPIAKAVFLNRVAGDLRLEPDVVLGLEARVGAVPSFPQSGYVVGIDGRLEFTLPRSGPFTIRVAGTGDVLGVTIARAATILRSDGYFRQRGLFELDAAVASFRADLDVAVDGAVGRFSAEFGLQACIFLVLDDACGSGRAILSNRGFAACVEIDAKAFTGSAYLGYRFPKRPPYDFGEMESGTGDGCDDDLQPFRIPERTPSARAAQSASPAFSLTSGTKIANVELTGSDGAPTAAAVIGPDGARVALDGSDRRAAAVTFPRARRTIILLRRPAGGSWRVELAAGSPVITQVRTATSLPPRRPVRARVARRNGMRTLRYEARPRSGERIVFLERTARGFERQLGVATRGGQLVLPQDDLGAGRRTVFAVREIGGLPRSREPVATYTAPGPRVPGTPRGLRVRRTTGSATIRVTPSAADTTRLVVALRDGRRFARDLQPGRRTTVVRGLLPQDRGTVTAVRVTATGRSGPRSRATIRARGRRTR